MTSNPPQSGVQQGQSTATSASNPTSSNTPLAATASAPARSYANATKKSATDSTAAPVTVGGSAQHGKSTSASPVNGNPMQTQQPQQPASGVTIVNGAPTAPAAATTASQGDHSRKPSVTITSAGTSGYMPNGGSASRPQSLQFGFANPQSSPNMGNPAVLANNQSQSGLGAPSANPRVTSPQTSPSPIPQPASSGGRPPSTYQGQGNVPNFGSFGESGDNNVRYIVPLIIFLHVLFVEMWLCAMTHGERGTRPLRERKKKKKKNSLTLLVFFLSFFFPSSSFLLY
jgi:translation initiation factor 4G